MPGIRIDVDTTSSFTNVKNLSKALSDLGKQGIVTESEIKKLTAEFQKKLAAEEAERKAAALGNTLDRVAKSCGMTAGQLADLRTKAGLAASSMAELNQSITLVHSSTSQSTANFANTGNSVDVLVGKVGLLAAGYISLQSAMQAVKSIASMESLRASFAGIFGDNGSEQFKYVIDAANKYGKSIEDTAGAYRKFAAAADYVGMSTENIRKIFEGTSQAITKVGGSSQDVSGALLAISQSIGKGQVMSEEFRQQFAERIPGAMKMAANAMGVTTGEFQKMMEAGQVLPNEFWPKMADEMSKFSQGWQASSQTLVSDFERMKNALMELGGNDVVQGVAKVLGFFTLGTVEESARRITSIFDDFSTKYKAIQAEMSGQLSPFEAWYTPIDELKKKLDDIAAKRSEYIAGLKTDVDSLTKSLADAQSKQLDFGPSGENVDVMRQKLKWFQDLLVQLTGQTWTVNVNANVDMSQLKQAQSYIQEVIKGTSEVKSRTIDAEREKLDNAVKILGKNKSDLEAQLASPTTDTWQKGSLGDQLKTINKDLDDAKLGYNELTKQQKKLTEQQVKDNSEVKKFNDSRGGVSGSEVTHDTQRIDAERLSIARQTDAWREYQAGLKTLPETYEVVSRAQEAESVTQDKITKAIERESKSRSSGANAAARYAERTSSYLEQAQDQYNQLVAQMGGDSLGAKLAAIDKRYDKAASSIRQAMIGAKGSTAELDATLEKMGQSKALEILMAQAEAWRKSMQDAANLLGEIGRLSGDPSAVYGSEMTTAQLWEADQQKRINAIEDETEREKQLGELRQAMALKEVAARADAYESVKAVSSKYWEAEKALLESHLERVKANADDELAYKIYAAQQWDEYNKKQLEQQAQTAGTFADTFAARWSLHFGSYKDEMTKTKESWDQMSDSIINSTDGMIDGVAGGFGDMIRNIGNGTASIEDLWKNMLARMLDAFASFVEKLVKQSLKDAFSGLFGDAEKGIQGVFSSSGSDTLSGGSSSSSTVADLGKAIGGASGSSFGSYLKNQTQSGFQFYAGADDRLAETFTDGFDASSFGQAAKDFSSVSASAMAQTYATAGSGTGSATNWNGILGNASLLGASALGLISSASSGNIGGLIGSGVSSAGSALGLLGASGSGLLGLSAAATGGIGAALAIGGMLVSSLFGGGSSSTTKTAEQYRLQIDPREYVLAWGNTADRYKTTTTGVFGSSTSTHTDWGDLPRDVGKSIEDSLKSSFKDLKDYAKTYGFSTEQAMKYNFTGITIDQSQVDAFKANMANVYAYKSLASSGMAGAVNYVTDPYETYTDALSRLSSATDTVSSSTEAYGYSLSAMAGITQDSIDAMRSFNNDFTANYKPNSELMASEMSGFVDVLNNLNWYYDTTSSDVAAAQNVSDDQLRKLLEAQYASKIIEAVGGDDAYTTIMTNLVKNTKSNLEAYTNQLDYYTNKAGESIGKLGDSAVTADNFWQKFSEAMKSGLSVDQFKDWADASTIVDTLNGVQDALDGVQDALDALEATAKQFTGSLDARRYAATGDDLNAKIAQQQADAEYELYQARAAGYDAATLLYLQEVQQLELDKIISDYNKKIADEAEPAAKQLKSALADLSSREYAAAGNDPMSKWTALIQSQLEELQSAYDNGYGQDFIDRLEAVQESERQSSWKQWQIDELNNTLSDLKTEFSKAVTKLTDAMSSMQTIVDAQLSAATSLSSDASSAMDSLKSTLYSVTTGDVSPLTSAEKASSLGGQIDTAYQTMLTAGHGQATIDAAQTISDLASDYLTAAKASMSYTDYLFVYADTVQKLNAAQNKTGTEYNYYERISTALDAEQSIFKLMLAELQKESPDSSKIYALVAASQSMGSSLSGIYADTADQQSWRGTVEGLLKQAGYSDDDITAALGGPTSTSSFLAQLNTFNKSTMPTYINSILSLLNDIKDVAGQINSDAPTVEPPSTDIGNQAAQAALASNVRTAMNSQYYAGRADWTVNEILANLSTYSNWASAYGISSTQGYTTPSDTATAAYYNQTAWGNRVSGSTDTWITKKTASENGGGNYITDWLNYGYRYWSFPTTDQTLYKTVQMVLQAFSRDSDLANYAGTPYGAAKRIASRLGTTWGFDGNNSASSLEAIAKTYYERYGSALGVIRPYAAGGFADAGSWGLVGEVGPEIVRFNTNTQITSNSASKNLLGDAFADLTAEVTAMRQQLYAAMRETAKNTQKLAKLADTWDTEGLAVREATA